MVGSIGWAHIRLALEQGPVLPYFPALGPGQPGMGSGKGTAVPRRHWQRKGQEGEGHQVQRDGSPGQPLGHQQASCQWDPFLRVMGLPCSDLSAQIIERSVHHSGSSSSVS